MRGKGTDRRAAGLAQLYETALQRLDTLYHNTAAHQTGPLVRRLQSFGKLEGLVVGPWGEGSKDLHSLVKTIADVEVAAKARNLGQRAWHCGGSGQELLVCHLYQGTESVPAEQTGVPWRGS